MKIMTPEYEAKLLERKEKKEKEAAPKRLEAFLKKERFTPEGYKYIVLGETFSRKDELKTDGARFDGALKRWYFNKEKVEGYDLLPVSYKEMYVMDAYGVPYTPDTYEAEKKIESAETELRRQESASEYVGEKGKRMEFNLTLKRSYQFETSYSYYGELCTLYTFEDEVGNAITWKTSSYIDIDDGDRVILKGTVKEHTEYKGIKQTVLTRCKVIEKK